MIIELERNMIWNGIDILYLKTRLLRAEEEKNKSTMTNHLYSGACLGFIFREKPFLVL